MPGAPVSGAQQRPATSRPACGRPVFPEATRPSAAAAQRLRGRFRPKYADLAPAGHTAPVRTLRPARYVVSRPTRKNTIFASRPRRNIFPAQSRKTAGASTALPPLWPSFRPQQRKKELVAGQIARFAAPFPSNTVQTRAARPKNRAAAISFRSFRPSPTPPSEGSSWSPHAARWSGPAPCRRSSRAPPGRCPDG